MTKTANETQLLECPQEPTADDMRRAAEACRRDSIQVETKRIIEELEKELRHAFGTRATSVQVVRFARVLFDEEAVKRRFRDRGFRVEIEHSPGDAFVLTSRTVVTLKWGLRCTL